MPSIKVDGKELITSEGNVKVSGEIINGDTSRASIIIDEKNNNPAFIKEAIIVFLDENDRSTPGEIVAHLSAFEEEDIRKAIDHLVAIKEIMVSGQVGRQIYLHIYKEQGPAPIY